jgi:hypothetical protein
LEKNVDTFWLYVLGALGALLTLYARSEEPIPAFRAFFDYETLEGELEKLKAEIKKDQETRKIYSEEYRNNNFDDKKFENLTKDIDDRISDNDVIRARLEGKVQQAQIIHRALGFIFYIVFGGLFAGLLSNVITVEGLDGTLGTAVKPIVLGATWTSYLTLLGFRDQKNKVNALTTQVNTKVDEMNQAIGRAQSIIPNINGENKDELSNLLNNAVSLSTETKKKLAKFK